MMLNQYKKPLYFGAGLLLSLSFGRQANALPNLSLSQRQQLARDLTVSASQDFFNQGRLQFDREIQLLQQTSIPQNPVTLKVNPNVPVPQQPDWKPFRHQSPVRSQGSPKFPNRLH